MPAADPDRRSFVASSVALAGTLSAGTAGAESKDADAPLLAYVGTFSSPLKDVLPTQVDLPPGNGRGIHIFKVDRTTGALAAAGVHEMGTSPSPYFPDDLRLSARHVRRNPGIPSDSASFLPK